MTSGHSPPSPQPRSLVTKIQRPNNQKHKPSQNTAHPAMELSNAEVRPPKLAARKRPFTFSAIKGSNLYIFTKSNFASTKYVVFPRRTSGNFSPKGPEDTETVCCPLRFALSSLRSLLSMETVSTELPPQPYCQQTYSGKYQSLIFSFFPSLPSRIVVSFMKVFSL